MWKSYRKKKKNKLRVRFEKEKKNSPLKTLLFAVTQHLYFYYLRLCCERVSFSFWSKRPLKDINTKFIDTHGFQGIFLSLFDKKVVITSYTVRSGSDMYYVLYSTAHMQHTYNMMLYTYILQYINLTLS